MKQFFEEPTVEVKAFHVEDVITTSADKDNTTDEY